MSKADVLLKKATSFEKLALYSDRKTFLKALSQRALPVYENHPRPQGDYDFTSRPNDIPPPEPEDPGAHEPPMMMPADKISAFPPIDPKTQEALSRIVSIDGIGIPIATDGKLGPETKRALQAFKKKFNFINMSDKDALQAALMKGEDPKYQINAYKPFKFNR
jgi:hypothetical protein